MNNTIIIYHGGCRDGFCAAWVFNKYLNDMREAEASDDERTNLVAIYHPGFYGQEPPNVKGKDVVILDFAYPLEIMKKIITEANSVKWIDHHKTAQPVVDWLRSVYTNDTKINGAVEFLFDNTRSGAGLTWDYFFPNEPRPWLVDYVEDRDLWAKKLNNTDVVNAYIACLEFDFKVWDDVSEIDVEDIAEYGQVAVMKTEQYVREVCKNAYFRDIENKESNQNGGLLNWLRIPTVNICQVDCSEVLHELCKRYPDSPFSLYWFKRQDGLYQYGLRSIGDFDVSSVARIFGGGGHKNAAGFQLPYLLQELQ